MNRILRVALILGVLAVFGAALLGGGFVAGYAIARGGLALPGLAAPCLAMPSHAAPAAQEALRRTMRERLRARLGVHPVIDLVPHGTLPGSEFKARRVIDDRDLYRELRSGHVRP